MNYISSPFAAKEAGQHQINCRPVLIFWNNVEVISLWFRLPVSLGFRLLKHIWILQDRSHMGSAC